MRMTIMVRRGKWLTHSSLCDGCDSVWYPCVMLLLVLLHKFPWQWEWGPVLCGALELEKRGEQQGCFCLRGCISDSYKDAHEFVKDKGLGSGVGGGSNMQRQSQRSHWFKLPKSKSICDLRRPLMIDDEFRMSPSVWRLLWYLLLVICDWYHLSSSSSSSLSSLQLSGR